MTLANTENRKRYNVIGSYDFIETAYGLYVHENIIITNWLKAIAGLRYDIISYKGDCKQDINYFNI